MGETADVGTMWAIYRKRDNVRISKYYSSAIRRCNNNFYVCYSKGGFEGWEYLNNGEYWRWTKVKQLKERWKNL